MIAALVPVKRFGGGKSRLLGAYSPAAVARLQAAMLEDVLSALTAAPGIDLTAVATEDPAVADRAKALGARPLLGGPPGLNPSLNAAGAQLAADGARGLLVVLGDVAGALPAELGAIVGAIEELGGKGVVLVPSHDGGSAALLRAPCDAMACGFGPESAERHRRLAAEAGVPFRELALPSLAVDLDRPEDLALIADRREGAQRTRALLAEHARETGT